MEEGLALLSGPDTNLHLDPLWLFRSLARGKFGEESQEFLRRGGGALWAGVHQQLTVQL